MGSPVHAPDPGPRIVPLLEGSSLGSGHGSFAFCSVVLVEATARDGQRRRIAAELAYIERPHARDFATPSWTKYLFADRRVRSVRDGDELLPGVTVVAAGGHSAGSIAVAVQATRGHRGRHR